MAGPAARGEALIFTAASLSNAVEEAAGRCESELGEAAVVHAAGTGSLVSQIRAGAPADVLFSASLEAFEPLVRAGRVAASAVRPLLSNRLVVVVPLAAPGPAPAAPADLARLTRLALADPEAVPAGIYARRFLEAAGLWESLAPRTVPALDVRAALATVETGLVPAGIVYRTDAARSTRVRVAFEVVSPLAPDIRYGLAPLIGSATGVRWVACLAALPARAVYARHGFLLLEPVPDAP